jgi:hypothetical protein
MVALLEGSAPVSPSEAILDLPPSRLTNDDWVRLYGEEFAEWMTLTPAERWRQSTQLWATWIALGGARNDELLADPGPSGTVDTAGAWRTGTPDGRTGLHRVRRLGV